MGSAAWPCILLMFLQLSSQQRCGVTVNTATGCLKGTFVSTKAGPVRAFLGIPYAEPPVGPARFKRTQPKRPWAGVLNAMTLPPMCPQMPLNFNSYYLVKETDPIAEDCLFLNIYAPPTNGASGKPVVVYIHGGFFSYGGISMKLHDASELAARGDLVVVTVAYRLGAFGFLNMGTEDAPGNMGLHDQLLALRWIKRNANAFGGDPDQITLVGQSAGSYSVGVHLVSPRSRGLFRRAIMQSGSPFTSTLENSKEQARHRARVLVDTLGCGSPEKDSRSFQTTASCMRSKNVTEILNATAGFTTQGLDGFFPVVGDDLIPLRLGKALKSRKLNARELLAGLSSAEGDGLIDFVAKGFRDNTDAADITKRTMIFFAKGMMITLLDLESQSIIDHYFGGPNVGDGIEAVHAAADLLGDSQLGCPTLGFARRFLGSDTTVFMYQFSQQPSRIGWPTWVRPTHADEIAFALGSVFKLESDVSEDDAKAAENFMHIISAFSHTGVPRVPDNTTWPKFGEERDYMEIGKEANVNKKHLLQSVCDIWEEQKPYE
ncbi:acetylcholinesterase [Rhipicephalus sanguineus]|uniref:acetylcholinesterase n=1 Tax=Rhipicephalus sanguineus TaxID=34632 RepID=UPI0018944E82|nr:acetylcholinesterase [Rhipicephalus sanguineus]